MDCFTCQAVQGLSKSIAFLVKIQQKLPKQTDCYGVLPQFFSSSQEACFGQVPNIGGSFR